MTTELDLAMQQNALNADVVSKREYANRLRMKLAEASELPVTRYSSWSMDELEREYLRQHELELSAGQITGGELKDWEIMLKVVSNGLGKVAVVFPTDLVATEPSEYMPNIANWIGDYLQD